MKVLVTGAAGFIGSNLADALLRRGDEVIGLDNFDPYYDPRRKRRNLGPALAHPRFELVEADVLDAPRLRALLAGRRPDGVVHLAARVSNRRSIGAADGDGYSAVNAGGTAALLAACREAPVRSFVLVSTANVYDSSAPPLFARDSPPSARAPRTRGASRRPRRWPWRPPPRKGLPATVLRLFTTYGRRQRPDMVHYRFTAALLRGAPLTVIGDGSDLRDYVHVDDAGAAIIACLDRPASGEVVNVASGTGTTIDALLELLARLTKKTPRIRHETAAAADTRLLLADITKAWKCFGWKPRVGLEAGLEDFVTWIKKNGVPDSQQGNTNET